MGRDRRPVVLTGVAAARLARDGPTAEFRRHALASAVHLVEPLDAAAFDPAVWAAIAAAFRKAQRYWLTLEDPARLPDAEALLAAVPRLRLQVAVGVATADSGGDLPAAALIDGLAGLAARRPGSLLAVVPASAANADHLFSTIYALVQRGVPFEVTLAAERENLPEANEPLALLLANLGSSPHVPVALRLTCRRRLRQLEATGRGDFPAAAVCLGDDAARKLSRALIEKGHVALSAAPRQTAVAAATLGRSLRIEQWRTLARGIAAFAHPGPKTQRPASAGREPCNAPRLLVVGWFGTETAGDKAILSALLAPLVAAAPALRATVISSLPRYTQRTLRELGLAQMADVQQLDYRRLRGEIAHYDLVMIAGGPLMDLVELVDIAAVLRLARRAGVATLVAGCGVGPVSWPLTRWAIRRIARDADRVVLRDGQSKRRLLDHVPRAATFAVGADPAAAFAAALATRPARSGRARLGMALREWPRQYTRSLPRVEYRRRLGELVHCWASVADHFVEQHDGEVLLQPMHTLAIGGDDRWLLAGVREVSRHPHRLHLAATPQPPAAVVEAIGSCDIFLAMRYHSLVFAVALGVPVAALDYTAGGKVAALAGELSGAVPCIDLARADGDTFVQAVEALWQRRAELAQRLAAARPELLARSSLAAEAALDLLRRSRA